jgi:phosphate transport system substrate-binding protein
MHILFGRTLIGTVVYMILTASVAWGSLAYNGSSTIGMGFMQVGATEQFSKFTGIKFTSISNDGSGKGLKALAEGRAQLAGSSRPLKAEEKAQGLVDTIIGFDAIAVFVHIENPVKNLSKAQLKGIFTGRIRNWKEVGGKDAPIVPNTEILTDKRGTIEMFKEMVLDGEKYGSGFKQIDLPKDQIVEVSRQKNGIASASRGLLVAAGMEMRSRVKIIRIDEVNPTIANVRAGSYPISRTLFLVTAGAPKGEIKTFIDFALSPAGQAIMRQNFVSIK